MITVFKGSGGFVRSFTLIALLVGIGAFPAFADIVNNGGFEAQDISHTNYYVTVSAASAPECGAAGNPTLPSLTGWTVTGCSVDIVNGPSWAHTGSQAIDLVGSPGPGGIEQSISTTPGAYYNFSFWASSNGGAITNGLDVGWNGVNIAIVSTPAQGQWTPFSYRVQATGSSTVISLSSPLGGDAGPLVDDVSVPEPSSLFGLGAGLALSLGLALRLRSV
jgi:hypothetical protein